MTSTTPRVVDVSPNIDMEKDTPRSKEVKEQNGKDALMEGESAPVPEPSKRKYSITTSMLKRLSITRNNFNKLDPFHEMGDSTHYSNSNNNNCEDELIKRKPHIPTQRGINNT